MATPKKRSAYGQRADALLAKQVNLVDEAGRAFDDWQAAKLAAVEQVEAAQKAAAEQIAKAKEAADQEIAKREDAYKSAYSEAEAAWSRKQLTEFGLPRPRSPRRAPEATQSDRALGAALGSDVVQPPPEKPDANSGSSLPVD